MTREQKIELAKQLRAEGLSYRKIGERVGANHDTVQRWLSPEYAEKKRKYQQSEKSREIQRKWRQSERGRAARRKYGQSEKRRVSNRKHRQSNKHPETTYLIGSPGCNRVVIGKTTNLKRRLHDGYNKSLFPLKLLGMTRIPEKAIHKRFKHLQVPCYSPEVFRLTPELQQFIQDYCWPAIFRHQDCFVGE